MSLNHIAVIGGGSMGTALAVNLSKKLAVTLVTRSHAETMAETRVNQRYLPAVRIPDAVRVTSDLARALQDAELILIATPVRAFEESLRQITRIRSDLPVIWACKGLSPQSGMPLSITAERLLGERAHYGILSGPSFADGLAANDPSAVVVATNAGREQTLRIAECLSNTTLRVYASHDLIGVQLCGAIKNVYAIAAGVIDGCGWGENTRAAMMTRAIAEAGRFLDMHAADKTTLMGLSGFGDIHLTCGSRLSRNYQIGMALAAGKSVSQALEALGHVAEGVPTTRLIHQEATRHQVDMPIVSAINDVLEGSKSPRECAAALMARDIAYESGPRRNDG